MAEIPLIPKEMRLWAEGPFIVLVGPDGLIRTDVAVICNEYEEANGREAALKMADLLVAAAQSYIESYGDRAVEAAESDTLRTALAALRAMDAAAPCEFRE